MHVSGAGIQWSFLFRNWSKCAKRTLMSQINAWRAPKAPDDNTDLCASTDLPPFLYRITCGNIRAVRKRPAHPTSVRLSLRLCLFIPSLPFIFLTIHPSATVVCCHHRACTPPFVCLSTYKTPTGTYLSAYVCIYLCVCVCVYYMCDVTNLHAVSGSLTKIWLCLGLYKFVPQKGMCFFS